MAELVERFAYGGVRVEIDRMGSEIPYFEAFYKFRGQYRNLGCHSTLEAAREEAKRMLDARECALARRQR